MELHCTDAVSVPERTCLPPQIALFLGGSFNPPHLSHIAAMESARVALESRGVKVIGGYFATATDGYLRHKMAKSGAAAMRAQHRLHLANQLAETTTWIRPVEKIYGSAPQLAAVIIPQLGTECAAGIVVGADRAVMKSGKAKWVRPGTKNSDTNSFRILKICIARGEDTKRVLDAMKRDRLLNEADAIQKAGFFLVPTEVEPVSSTIVRQRILTLRQHDQNSTEYETNLQKIVDDRLLPRNVIEYIMMFSEKDLYHPPLEKKQIEKSDADSED